ncbi:MAG TPA: hypothetical protein VD999_03475 [Vitreimonas sp.]|nr:hypothetical protein [Vitreimonas sp.]
MNHFQSYREQLSEIGYITKMVSGLVWVSDLPGIKVGEIVVLENDIHGRVLSVGEHEVKIMLLGSELEVKPGMMVARTGEGLKVFVSDHLLGKNIDSLGRLLHHHGPPYHTDGEWRVVEAEPLSLESRATSRQSLDTGVALVDLMIPLAKGQRELVIGDKKTGKSQFVLQTMLTQAHQGSICIYAGIARKPSAISAARQLVEKAGVADQCVFVTSDLGDSPGSIFLTPYTAMTLAEYFRDQGHDVLVIFDNMSAHAEYYREIALLAQEFPGKEAYPGDVFFIHSRLMERAGSFMINDHHVSITCLPIAETNEGDLAGYIQTNLMSMTDGHLFFDLDLFLAGRKPALNLLLSVTRVGRQTQTPLQHELSNKLLELVGEYQKAQGFLRFGAELSGHLKEILDRGLRLESTLDQLYPEVIDRPLAMVLAGLLWSSDWSGEKIETVKHLYATNKTFHSQIKILATSADNFETFIKNLRQVQESWKVS